MSDYIMSIDSDAEDIHKQDPSADTGLNPDFIFDIDGDRYVDLSTHTWIVEDLVKIGSKPKPISVDTLIARRLLQRKRGTASENELEFESEDEAVGGSDPDRDTDDSRSSISKVEEEFSIGDEQENKAERDRKAAFFDLEASKTEIHDSFLSMNLSRPIIKALTNLGFSKPTPIQAATIPVALLGKDVVGNAVTGSGKTAAFVIPMLERLLYREKGKKAAAIRCVVLVPTRELGVQCFDVGRKLATFTDIRLALLVGGLSLKSQEASLRTRPEIIIATPGRLIDHVRNSLSFSLDAVDILVLDEADRMLEDGFADQLSEIIKSCPLSRQTMLFSATMTDSVDALVKMSLKKPVRLFVDPKRSTARNLTQEFVRVRAGKESERPALLVSLCKRTFRQKVIIFLRSKKLAHQMRIMFGLLGMKSEELHGDLTQEQRLKALHAFRESTADYLMATDLAARGLDIRGVETVINYDMPSQLAQYLHRVGRTARAGNFGRAVTLVGESDRKMLKAAIKHSLSSDQVRHRIIPPEVIQTWFERLQSMSDEIAKILQEEKTEKRIRLAEMELVKEQNMIEHQDEIFSRPARTWFQTANEKRKSKDAGKDATRVRDTQKPTREKISGLTRKQKRRKLATAADEEFGQSRSLNAAIRAAKKRNDRRNCGNDTHRYGHDFNPKILLKDSGPC